jgi:hypothetical protein
MLNNATSPRETGRESLPSHVSYEVVVQADPYLYLYRSVWRAVLGAIVAMAQVAANRGGFFALTLLYEYRGPSQNDVCGAEYSWTVDRSVTGTMGKCQNMWFADECHAKKVNLRRRYRGPLSRWGGPHRTICNFCCTSCRSVLNIGQCTICFLHTGTSTGTTYY